MNGISPPVYQLIVFMHTLISGLLLIAILTNMFGYAEPIAFNLKLIIGSVLAADLIMFPILLKGAVRK